jgi:hypothetical protein
MRLWLYGQFCNRLGQIYLALAINTIQNRHSHNCRLLFEMVDRDLEIKNNITRKKLSVMGFCSAENVKVVDNTSQ